MISLFQISSADQSVTYLSQIFGSMYGIIPGGTGDITILGVMFKTFNATLLAIGALMLVYFTVVGVMATAHEGEFMGKKWNNIWIPLRIVFGIGMMVPTASGYSFLQLAMMWVIIQGIGAADVLWTTAINYTDRMGNVYAQGTLQTITPNMIMAGLYQGMVCDATTKLTQVDPTATVGGAYYCSGAGNPGCGTPTPAITTGATTLNLGPNGYCGSLSYCNQTASCATDTNSMGCQACMAQVTYMQTVMTILQPIASAIATADLSYRDFYHNSAAPNNNNHSNWSWITKYCTDHGISPANCCIPSDSPTSTCPTTASNSLPSPDQNATPSNANSLEVDMIWQNWPSLGPNLGANYDFVSVLGKGYTAALNAAYTNFITAQNAQRSNSELNDAQANGWITAGGYYYALANNNSAIYANAQPILTWNAPASIGSGPLSKYRNNYNAAGVLLGSISGSNSVGNANGSNGGGANGGGGASNNTITTPTTNCDKDNCDASSKFGAPITQGIGNVKASFQNTFGNPDPNAPKANPLIALQIIGTSILAIVDLIFIVTLAVLVVVAMVGFGGLEVAGNGFENPVGPAAQFIMLFFEPAIYAAMGVLIGIGSALGVYTPLIPYIVFTFGALSWLISVVEAMVAGPLVAIGIISPSGQHELLGKAEPALMLLFNVFLRPSLMIFGLITAMLMAIVAVQLINKLYWPVVFVDIFYQGGLEIIGTLMFVTTYVVIILSALNKCFSMINVIPQQVMRWISGQGEQVDAPLNEVKGGIESTGGGVAGAGAGAGKIGSEKGKNQDRKDAKAARDAKQKSKGGFSGGST